MVKTPVEFGDEHITTNWKNISFSGSFKMPVPIVTTFALMLWKKGLRKKYVNKMQHASHYGTKYQLRCITFQFSI
jgi:hypothetical protein